MVRGTLEVLLVRAKGLEDHDLFGKMDPYAILTYRTQEQRSKVASGQGKNPEWNETFVFTVSDTVKELEIKLMDSDKFTKDDFVGHVTIHLGPLFEEGIIHPTAYSVVKEDSYCGELKVGLTFFPEITEEL